MNQGLFRGKRPILARKPFDRIRSQWFLAGIIASAIGIRRFCENNPSTVWKWMYSVLS